VQLSQYAVMKNSTTNNYTIDELASLVELPRRTVRYYIQQGLLDKPIGEKRSAYYTSVHLEQLLTIRKWQQAGLSLERIRDILAGGEGNVLPPARPRGAGTVEVWSHLVVADGLEVTLEPSRAGLNSEQVREFFRAVTSMYEQIKQQGADDADE